MGCRSSGRGGLLPGRWQRLPTLVFERDPVFAVQVYRF